MGLDGDGYLLEFVDLTNGKTHKINWAKILKLSQGPMAVFNMGFTDYGWYQTLTANGVYMDRAEPGN